MASGAKAAAAALPLGSHAADVRRRIEMMEHLLERSVPIPGTKAKVGLDAILGLVPVGGDLIAALGKQEPPIDERTVDVWVGRLRRALRKVGAGERVRTVRSLGYVYDSYD